MKDLAKFDTELRQLLEKNARPFVCDGSPLACDIFLVGANPATAMNRPFWEFWDSNDGFDKKAWYIEYKRERKERPLRCSRCAPLGHSSIMLTFL